MYFHKWTAADGAGGSDAGALKSDGQKSFEVVPMQWTDAEAAARLEAENFAAPWTRKMLLESLSKPEYSFFAARAKDSKVLVGYAGAYLCVDELNITDVVTDREWRRMGVASALLKAYDELAKKAGITGITLEVRVSNRAAFELYRKNGYETAGVRKGFYDAPKEDAYIMWKHYELNK